MAEDIKLSDVKNMEDKYTLHIMIRSISDPVPKLQLDSKKLQECREKFQFLRASKRSREKVIFHFVSIFIYNKSFFVARQDFWNFAADSFFDGFLWIP